jgi:hypothetical protein
MDTPDFTIPDELVNDAPSENAPKPKKTRRSRYDPEPDWSAMVRAKVTKPQHRVGQACDRCKVCLFIFCYRVGFDSGTYWRFCLISSSRRWSVRPILEVALVVSSSTFHAKSLTVSLVRPGCVVRLGECEISSRVSRSRPRTWRSRSRSFSRRTHSYRPVWEVPIDPILWVTTRYVFNFSIKISTFWFFLGLGLIQLLVGPWP